MTRIARGVLMAFVVVEAAIACHKAPPPPPPAPAAPAFNEDSARQARARADSIAAANRRRDSIASAQAAAAAARARADSITRENARLAAAADAARRTIATVVVFNYDQATLEDAARNGLDAKVPILTANSAVRIRIDGSADERGSDEYNLALGQRRAEAAKAYLVSRGISADRIDTRSLGEDSPLAQGHDETSWAQNRRDDFVITAGGDNIR